MTVLLWSAVGIVAVILLLALAFWPARVARRKGHSGVLFFLFSLLLFFPALIVAYLVPDRRQHLTALKLRDGSLDATAARGKAPAPEHRRLRTTGCSDLCPADVNQERTAMRPLSK